MNWKFDPSHTQVEFAVKHLGMMTVRGHFAEVTTSGHIDPANPDATSVEVTINAASVKTNNEGRDNHLRTSEFLDVDKYPTITFKSTRIEPQAGDRFKMTGDLTIKGNTHPVTLRVRHYGEISDPLIGHRMGYGAEGKINRKDFGLTLDMVLDGKFVLGKEVKIMIELELVEQQQPAEAAA